MAEKTKPQTKLEKALDKQGVTEEEVLAILKSSHKKPNETYRVRGPASHIKYMCISDAHIGHEKFLEDSFLEAVKIANKEKVDFVVDPGDHLEGMSGRPGHIYELEHIGFTAQMKKCAELYAQFKMPIYGIDGNHDQWYAAKNNGGVIVGEHMQNDIPNYTHLGQDEGRLQIGPLEIMLFHPNDGTAYATSYKGQKMVESFTGGEKPHILHEGHYHKALYFFLRNVHTFESGTLCGQSKFMRGKKIPAHTGFWIVDVWYNKDGVKRLRPEFYPIYEK